MEPTEKQISAIKNMGFALGWGIEYPDTKKECSKLIGEMMAEIKKRKALTGRIGYVRSYDDILGEQEDYFDPIY